MTYDGVGNLLNWWSASSLEWSGRELQKTSITGGNALKYSYNSDGIRTEKVFANSSARSSYVRNYTFDGTKIIKENISIVALGGSSSYELYYIYDASGGDVVGFHYNGTPYYFQKNLQGDVIRIVNSVGTVVVEYTYDAWGKLLSTTGTLASTLGAYNPFRYRGYYYDSETGFYYLQNRYYDPTVGRFLNADGMVAGISDSVQGYNLYAYCFNNPINLDDSNGNWPKWVEKVAKVVSVAVAVVAVVATVAAVSAFTAQQLYMELPFY